MFTLPVDALLESSPYLTVRDVKEWYVQYLMQRQLDLDEEGDHEDLMAPLIIASVTSEHFKQKNLHKYTYKVMFGLLWDCTRV